MATAISSFYAPATLRDVAREAGVSVATVSKALHGKGSLRQDTRDRVRQVAARLNFRPNGLAQSLHSRRTLTVGLLSNDIYGRFTLPVLAGIEQALAASDVAVYLCNAADDPAKERRHVEALLSRRVDGFILTARRLETGFSPATYQTGVPTLSVNVQDPRPDGPCLLADDQGGARMAVRHLASLGRRRIAHVTGPDSFRAVRLRGAGYLEGLAEAGLPAIAGMLLLGAWSEDWGWRAVEALFAGQAAPDAVFCGSDQIGRGVADALRARGLRVPQDVALVGYDNWEVLAAATRPPLTSVDPDLHALGCAAGEMLMALRDGFDQPPGTQRRPCRLVVRQSCGAHPP